jgi:hypothetical protein
MNVPLLELRTIMSQCIHEELERFTDEGLSGAVKASPSKPLAGLIGTSTGSSCRTGTGMGRF